ncbi:Membrane-associated zinc metalloprotease [hydrothermal vent metagenome]|uniref:Membrane-associated zinc metalloprotease n=1 Tax=hydrothermal vent metagenome TaxID=652676 RepID=A0A1W1DGH6_9ZZZZ
MAFFTALISFIVTIGILVTVHEFGHFWVAKKLGIKVLRFSIGFGKVLKSWKRGETEYTLCALPFGGFVKMLDENEGEVDAKEKHRAFNTQNVYKRIAVVIAGPAANFILAIILYAIIFIIGTHGIKPVVGLVKINSIAEHSGLQVGDQLLSINSQNTPTIGEFSMGFIQALEGEILQLKVISKTSDLKTLTLDLKGDFLANPEQGVEHYLGFEFAMPVLEPIINQVMNASAADLAGIQSNDKILQANGKAIDSWRDFVEVIKRNPQQPIQLQVERNHRIIELTLTPKNENGTPKAGVSVMVPDGYLDEWRVLVKKGVLDAFLSANVKVYQLTLLNLKIIKKMILGEVSLKQLSGPVSIADYAGKTAQLGLISFLSFLALISIGLGLLNLLPIPLLDGGHLFFYLIEILKGSPVSQAFQQVSIKLGLFVILSLTFVALYNDFLRLLS